VNGTPVGVTEAQYLAYYRGERRMRYFERDIKTETAIRGKNGRITGYTSGKEDSLDRLLENGADFPDEGESVEDAAIRALMIDRLREALGTLAAGDRELIDALFFSNGGGGTGERGCAGRLGLSKTALHARKEKIFAKLRKLLENNFHDS
jgi:DNA-directed RNA polymerase specialized sigma24 family protein